MNDYFSKGLCSNYGDNRMPRQYSPNLRNVRIENGVTVPRKGFRSVVESTSGERVRGIASNNGKLYVCANSKFRSVDFANNAYFDIGNLPNDKTASILTYGKYTMIFTEDAPYVYDGTTLSAVTTYSAGTAPRFGANFANFTWIAGGLTYSNILYISRPIKATTQNYCYDWTGSGSDQIVCKSDIVGLASTLDRLIVFQKDRIEYTNRNSYATIGGVTTFFLNPLAVGEEAVSHQSIVVAGDRIIFLTKQKKIKSINYVQGVDQLAVGDLSDNDKVGITTFMDSLHDDQSQSFGYYDPINKLVKFHVRSGKGAFNDTVIIYDLVAQTFLHDDSKFFSCATMHEGKHYCGSFLNASTYQDEYGTDDDGAEISWYREGAPLCSEAHGTYKIWMGAITSGTINGTTQISKTLVVDGFAVDQSTISKGGAPLGASFGSHPVGSSPVGGPTEADIRTDFVKIRTDGYVNIPGRYFQANYSGKGVSNGFSLETLQTKEKATKYSEPINDF